jgi:hypothetical protein
MMEGPSEISLKFEPGKILITSEKCKKYVNGGTIMATARDKVGARRFANSRERNRNFYLCSPIAARKPSCSG